MNKMTEAKKLLSLTDKAALHINNLLNKADSTTNIKGLHITVKNTGCAGMAYDVNYAEDIPANSLHIEDKNIQLYVDNFASVFLAGSVIDYKSDLLSAGFTFENPNATGECGCGESFTIDKTLGTPNDASANQAP